MCLPLGPRILVFFSHILFIFGPCTGGGPDVEASNVVRVAAQVWKLATWGRLLAPCSLFLFFLFSFTENSEHACALEQDLIHFEIEFYIITPRELL